MTFRALWLKMALAMGCAMSTVVATPGSAKSDAASVDPAALFTQAHRILGSGIAFTPATCAQAAPVLDRVIGLTGTGPERATTRAFAMLERGYCKLVDGDAVGATTLFAAVVDTAARWPAGQVNVTGNARACLAHAYAVGLGVPQDRERAVGHYVASEGYRCVVVDYDPAEEAAQLILAMDPFSAQRPGGLVYHFLRQGSARDFLTAVKLHSAHLAQTGNWQELFTIAMQGLEAAGDSPADRAAKAELNRVLGEGHLARHNRAEAYGYLLAANTPAARAILVASEADAPFTLTLPGGRRWSPPDAQ